MAGVSRKENRDHMRCQCEMNVKRKASSGLFWERIFVILFSNNEIVMKLEKVSSFCGEPDLLFLLTSNEYTSTNHMINNEKK